jgi:hypothetical protein
MARRSHSISAAARESTPFFTLAVCRASRRVLTSRRIRKSDWQHRWNVMLGGLGLLWHECGQDFALFCYRIGYSAVTVIHSRALTLAPVSLAATKLSVRKTEACSNPSSTFSAHSTTLKD